MKRSEFIRAGIAAPALFSFSSKDSHVEEFVRAGHNDLERVKVMLDEDPTLINASYNWGDNDFETALEGAAHVGNSTIANFLLSHGARPTIFVMAMLGQMELIAQWIGSYPDSLYARGPHGFSLLHHARVGKHSDLEKWILDAGLTTSKFS